MHRFALLLSTVVVLSGAVMLLRLPAAAQEATPSGIAAMANHPVVGAWQVVTGVGEDTFPSVAIFHADGTYTEVLPWGQLILGVWQPTGERTVVLTQIFNYLVDDELVEGQARGTMEVDATGTTLTFETVSVGRFRDGRIDFTDEDTPTTATRLEAGPMLSLDELLAVTEPVGGGTPEVGTPIP